MAMQDKDYIPSDDGADEMNSNSYERTLPLDKNTRNSPQERSMLDPKLSDFDAMIVQMAGETDIHKIENFMQLT